jgi:predicted metal-binding membrane protein
MAARLATVGSTLVDTDPQLGGSLEILRAVGPLIGVAWLTAVLLQMTGTAAAVHHHALIDGIAGEPPPPLWLGIPAFLIAWQLMISAMMLPASLGAIARVAARLSDRPVAAIGGFLAAYFLAWSAFGLAAFAGDIGLHGLVHALPWLAQRPWLIPAASLALAGAYQLLPVRRRALNACRHPQIVGARRGGAALAGFRVGLAHAADCLVCSWALMLLLFAVGVDNLAWMAALAALMAYEALGRHGQRLGIAVGAGLLAMAGLTATGALAGF